MAIGSSKIGVLGGKAVVPGGSETFNSPGTFTVPLGVSVVTITGQGGAGNPGNAGGSGNGGLGGAGGGPGRSYAYCFCSSFAYRSGGDTGGIGGGNNPICCGIGKATGGNVGPNFGAQGNTGGTGSNGNPSNTTGNPGNAGNSSTGLSQTFPGGSAGNGGNGGTGGSGGTGGVGGTPCNRPLCPPAFGVNFSNAYSGIGGAGGTTGGGAGANRICACGSGAQSIAIGGGGAGDTNPGTPGNSPSNFSPLTGLGGTPGGGRGSAFSPNPSKAGGNVRAGGGGAYANRGCGVPTGNYGGSGGGGGRGGAGNAGNPGNAGNAGSPTAYPNTPVTPGSSYPISVASPGGQINISWNPQ